MIGIRWNPTAKDLRGFGWVILIGFGLIGLAKAFWPFAWLLDRNFGAGLWILGCAALVGVPAIFGWRIVLPAYRAWMGIAWLAHKIMFPLMFGAFFYLVFFPIGVVMRLAGHDPLRLKRRDRETHWVPIEPARNPDEYERQY